MLYYFWTEVEFFNEIPLTMNILNFKKLCNVPINKIVNSVKFKIWFQQQQNSISHQLWKIS